MEISILERYFTIIYNHSLIISRVISNARFAIIRDIIRD